ncbi:MAG: hypothetical protein H6839_06035 [Planctomycetes bacterium]|nr:hypothetical protein [Planctomycetota bacterium]
MPGEDDTNVEWVKRDSREWVVFAHQPDQLTARMTCTYLESGGIEARVGTQAGHYCVEVPLEQLEDAFTVYTPPDSGVLPAMEVSRKTGIHTGVHLRDMLKNQQASGASEPRRSRRLLWLFRLVVLAVLVALLLFLFAD